MNPPWNPHASAEFGHPDAAQAIAKYAAAQLAPAAAPAPAVLRAAPPGAERGPLAALSTACRFPAGGEDPEIFWTALAAGLWRSGWNFETSKLLQIDKLTEYEGCTSAHVRKLIDVFTAAFPSLTVWEDVVLDGWATVDPVLCEWMLELPIHGFMFSMTVGPWVKNWLISHWQLDMWSSPTPLGSRVLITNRQRWTVTAVLFRCRRQMVWQRFPTIAGMWVNTSIHRPKWDVSWALDSQVAWVTLRERTPTEHIST